MFFGNGSYEGQLWKYKLPNITIALFFRFEPDMLAFSGCYYGGGEKERKELGEIRKRWDTLPVRLLKLGEISLLYIFQIQACHLRRLFSILFPFDCY